MQATMKDLDNTSTIWAEIIGQHDVAFVRINKRIARQILAQNAGHCLKWRQDDGGAYVLLTIVTD